MYTSILLAKSAAGILHVSTRWSQSFAGVEHPRVFRALVAQIAEREMTTSFTSQVLEMSGWSTYEIPSGELT